MTRTPDRAASESGFTLLEVLVALALTGMIALVAHALFGQVLLATESIERSREAGAQRGRMTWLLDACGSVDVGNGPTEGFDGTDRRASFISRLPDLRGRTVPESVSVSITDDAIDLRLGQGLIRLSDSVGAGSMDYFIGGDGPEAWVTAWHSAASTPGAMRLRWTRAGVPDSLLCPIGERG